MPRRMLGITCCCVLLPLLGCSGASKAELDRLKADLETAQKENARLKETISSLKAAGASESGRVTGKVVYRGRPLPAGSVTFHAADGKAAFGMIDDGVYQVRGVPAGKVRITVETASARRVLLTGLPGLAGAEEEAKARESKTPVVPTKYTNPDSTPLTCVIQGGEQTHDLSLED
jgi:hypothetical protein